MTDRGPGDRETEPADFQEFRNEARARSADLARLSPAEAEAIERVGRLFRQLRYSRGLSLPDISARADVPVVYLALMEHGLLGLDELQPGFLAKVGTALESDVEARSPDRGGAFAAIASTMLRSDGRGGPAGGNAAVTGLMSTIESTSADVAERVRAVWELGEHVREQRARGALVRALSADADPRLCMAAVESLGPVADLKEVRSVLLALLSGPDEALRARAAGVVAESVSENQPGCGELLSRIERSALRLSEARVAALADTLGGAVEAPFGLSLRPHTDGRQGSGHGGLRATSPDYTAELILGGDGLEPALVLSIVFVDPSEWVGSPIRVVMSPGVDGLTAYAGWRVSWEGFGPDLVDSTEVVAATGLVEVTLARASHAAAGADPASHWSAARDILTILARSLDHPEAVSRLRRANA